MRLFFADFQRIIELNGEVLDSIATMFPAFKSTIVPIRNQLTAAQLNATHVINGEDSHWFALLMLSFNFLVRVNDLNQKFKRQGYEGEALINKFDEVAQINLNINTLDELENELKRLHLAFDSNLRETLGQEAIDQFSKTTDIKLFVDLFTNSPLVTYSKMVNEDSKIINVYIAEHDQDITICFSGAEAEAAFIEKWFVQDGIEPMILESFKDTYSFEDEEHFLNWYNNLRIQFQIELGLETLVSFFDSPDEADQKRLLQIRHDLNMLLNSNEANTLLSHRLMVWNYIFGHLNSFEEEKNKRSFKELKSIFDLEDSEFKVNFYS